MCTYQYIILFILKGKNVELKIYPIIVIKKIVSKHKITLGKFLVLVVDKERARVIMKCLVCLKLLLNRKKLVFSHLQDVTYQFSDMFLIFIGNTYNILQPRCVNHLHLPTKPISNIFAMVENRSHTMFMFLP